MNLKDYANAFYREPQSKPLSDLYRCLAENLGYILTMSSRGRRQAVLIIDDDGYENYIKEHQVGAVTRFFEKEGFKVLRNGRYLEIGWSSQESRRK